MTDRTHPDSGFPIAYSHYANYAEYVEALHARIAELEAQLESIGAGGVSGPLMGKPQEMPDLTTLTERGAKAWAGVDAQGLREGFTAADMATASAQGFRDGVASVAASVPAPSGHIKEPYTVAEIKAKIASNDYSAEMLLQHAMLLLDSASLAASAGSEPVATVFTMEALAPGGGVKYHATVHKPLPAGTKLYLHPSPPEGMVGGWISVDERLPEWAARDDTPCFINGKEVPPTLTSETVLVALKGGGVRTDKLTTIEGKSDGWWHTYGERVVAWQKTPTTSAGSGRGE